MKRNKLTLPLRRWAIGVGLFSTLLCLAGGLGMMAPPPVFSSYSYSRSDTIKALFQVPQNFYNTRPNLLERPEALKPFFKRAKDKKKPLRVLHLGDSHIFAQSYPNSVAAVMQGKWSGMVNDTVPRLSYGYLAKNGATMRRWLHPENLDSIAGINPHLVIISFGTNECHSLKYDAQRHMSDINSALNDLRAVCPEACFVVTAPPGAYLKGKPNPMTESCVAVLRQFAKEHNLAFWNLYEIVGGSYAPENYINTGIWNRDRVHFTEEGYTILGTLLGESLLTASRLFTND
jgi:lysophospholipase L1-like esterase